MPTLTGPVASQVRWKRVPAALRRGRVYRGTTPALCLVDRWDLTVPECSLAAIAWTPLRAPAFCELV
jgi:hypothetical protein